MNEEPEKTGSTTPNNRKAERKDVELRRQLRFAKAVNGLAGVLITSDDKHILLNMMVEIIGKSLEIDRTVIFRVDFKKNIVEGVSEWMHPRTINADSAIKQFSLDLFLSGALAIWKTHKPLISHYNEVNPILVGDGSSEAIHGEMRIKSLLWIPFYFRDNSFYILAFNQISGRRDWAEDEIGFMETVAELVTIAIQKLDEQKKHKEAENQLKNEFLNLKRTLEDAVNALALIAERRDPYVVGHQRRVAQLACAIVKEMGLSNDRSEGVRMAATVHDIGKIHIPAEILAKPARLTDVEFGLVQTHADIGYEILKDIDFPWPVAKIVKQHHERINGSGYPEGLKTDDICLEARVISVADVVEAMTSLRAYREMKGLSDALNEINGNKGVLYDPSVADACLRLFNEKNFSFD